METCPCCFLEYDLKIERVQMHDWIAVENESAKHWICNVCHVKINKCPQCRIRLKTQKDIYAIQPYVLPIIFPFTPT